MKIKHIPILMYHTIEPEDSSRLLEEEKFYNVTPEKFEEQLKYLKDNGFGTVTIKQLIDSERDGELPPKPVMITFDDGHISHYQNAAPILKEYGFTAVFFIVVNDIGKKDRVMWDEVCGLFSDGMDIGSHGMSHKRLNESSYADLINELKASKLTIEEELHGHVHAFSIPKGFHSKKISSVARGMGYKLVFTSSIGNVSLDSDPYCLKRIVVRRDYNMKDFADIVNRNPVFIIRKVFQQTVIRAVKGVLGVGVYDFIKKRTFKRK